MIMPPFQPHLNVNDEGRPNGERADSAFVALAKHYQRVNACTQFPFVELEAAMTDLLTDLEHLCHRDGISFANCTRIARSHFEIESAAGSFQ